MKFLIKNILNVLRIKFTSNFEKFLEKFGKILGNFEKFREFLKNFHRL